ncbi:MAG: hypothetical protein ACK40L_05445, partial [Hydrogenophaga sp.]
MEEAMKKKFFHATPGIFRPMVVGMSLACVAGASSLAMAQSANRPPPGFEFCAAEDQGCRFVGTGQVIYGARTSWTQPRTVRGAVACNNAVFGDPLRRVPKACYV